MKNVIKFPKKAPPRNDLMAVFAMDAISGLSALFDQAGEDLDINSRELCGLFNVLHNALETGILPDSSKE